MLERKSDITILEITIHEGRNRQIRKMCELAGLKLTKLKRVSESNFRLGELPVGKWRYITNIELQEFFANQAK